MEAIFHLLMINNRPSEGHSSSSDDLAPLTASARWGIRDGIHGVDSIAFSSVSTLNPKLDLKASLHRPWLLTRVAND